MKKVLLLVALVALMATPAFAYISGSAHDFSGLGWTANGQICVACHTPHGGSTTISDAPLWNHTETTTAYSQYVGGGTLTALDVAATPTGISALCLSCHDGTVAPDSFGGATGTATISAYANLNSDGMVNDHPISFTYDGSLATADGGLFDPTTTASGIVGSTGNIDADMLFGTGNTELECASCHDVHNGGNGGLGYPKLLVKSNANSALCLTCHNK